MIFVLNTLVSALVIATVAWISRKMPGTAGFIVALPLATMLVLPLAYLQHRDTGTTFELAKSIFFALPITVLFFVPFLFRERLTFWGAYALGCALLPVGYFIHRAVLRALG